MVRIKMRQFFNPSVNPDKIKSVSKWLACLLVGALIAGFSHYAKAQVLFEGYSKVLSAGQHVGYIVNRYEFDKKKKQFVSISFLKTNEVGGNLAESLVARAAEDFTPISYQYTTVVGGQSKSIDAKFAKGKILATIKDGAKIEKIDKDLPKGTFLSTFLGYVMAKNPKGITPDAKYDYQAIAEEDAAVYKGVALIKNKEDFQGVKAYKILNEFKGTKFVSYLSEKAEVLASKSPVLSIATEVVAQPSLATAGHNVPVAILKQLFGEVPTGQMNEIARNRSAGAVPLPPPPTEMSAKGSATNTSSANGASTGSAGAAGMKTDSSVSGSSKNESDSTSGSAGESPTTTTAAPKPIPIPGKQYGIPGGKGIQIKGTPNTPATTTPPPPTK
jgi:hypothetical protein